MTVVHRFFIYLYEFLGQLVQKSASDLSATSFYIETFDDFSKSFLETFKIEFVKSHYLFRFELINCFSLYLL